MCSVKRHEQEFSNEQRSYDVIVVKHHRSAVTSKYNSYTLSTYGRGNIRTRTLSPYLFTEPSRFQYVLYLDERQH